MIDEWLTAHPDFGALPHIEEPGAGVATAGGTAQSSASLGATDPGALLDDAPDSAVRTAE